MRSCGTPSPARVLTTVVARYADSSQFDGHGPPRVTGRWLAWPSNWELSAYRATTVVRYLTGDGVPGARMVANGYSDTRPLVPPGDPNSITVNRRVDVVVLSDASAEAKELLPGLDAGTTDAGTTDAGTPQEDTHG